MYAIMIMAVVQIVLNVIMFMKLSGSKAQSALDKAASHVCDGDCADEKARAAAVVRAAPDSAINSAGQVFDTVKPFAAARQARVTTEDEEQPGQPEGCGAKAKMHKLYRGSSAAAYPAVLFNRTKNMGVDGLSFMPTMNAKPKNPSTADPWGGVGRPAIS